MKSAQCKFKAAIEPIIGQIKTDCSMAKNFLKGVFGNKLNAMLVTGAFNLRKAYKEGLCWLQILLQIISQIIEFKISKVILKNYYC